MKVFNLNTLPKQNGGNGPKQPRVTFGKSGIISFNPAACALLELKPDSKIALSQDEEEPDNWYFYLDKEAGYTVRAGYDKKGCLFNHAVLGKEVTKYFELAEDATHNFKIAGQSTIIKNDKTKYWGIIKPVKI